MLAMAVKIDTGLKKKRWQWMHSKSRIFSMPAISTRTMNLKNSVATPLMLRYAQETALFSTNGVITNLVRDHSP
jgi:hypothetical protein